MPRIDDFIAPVSWPETFVSSADERLDRFDCTTFDLTEFGQFDYPFAAEVIAAVLGMQIGG